MRMASIIGCTIAILWCGCTITGTTGTGSYDCSTPEAATASMRNAVEKQDFEGWLAVVADPARKRSRQEFVEKGREWYEKANLTQREESWRDLGVYSQAKVVRIERYPIDTQSLPFKQVKVWWAWPEKGKEGYWLLTPQHGGWRVIMGLSHAHAISDFSDPKHAYVSIGNAIGSGDTFAIFNHLASSVRVKRTFGQLDRLWKNRLRDSDLQENTKETNFASYGDKPEVEAIEPENGFSRVKVWQLNEDGERQGYEVFVKEGRQWKWGPRKETIWHPDFRR